jgi:ASC-1-like (ASCH) protein
MTTPMIVPDVLRAAVQGDPFWEHQLERVFAPEDDASALHLAIFVNPYLQLLLDGQKTVESRFSTNRRAPYYQVQDGDVVLLKHSGKPITGIGLVVDTKFYQITPAVLREIREQFADELAISDPSFWSNRERASFATLLRLSHIRALDPIPYLKRDQRAWIILKQRATQTALWPPATRPA